VSALAVNAWAAGPERQPARQTRAVAGGAALGL